MVFATSQTARLWNPIVKIADEGNLYNGIHPGDSTNSFAIHYTRGYRIEREGIYDNGFFSFYLIFDTTI